MILHTCGVVNESLITCFVLTEVDKWKRWYQLWYGFLHCGTLSEHSTFRSPTDGCYIGSVKVSCGKVQDSAVSIMKNVRICKMARAFFELRTCQKLHRKEWTRTDMIRKIDAMQSIEVTSPRKTHISFRERRSSDMFRIIKRLFLSHRQVTATHVTRRVFFRKSSKLHFHVYICNISSWKTLTE